jgi:hypothetical protein
LNLILLVTIGCENSIKKAKDEIENTDVSIAKDPSKLEWVSLFDGRTFQGWHNYNGTPISDEWQVIDSALVFTPNPDKDHGLNNLMTDSTYTSFILSLDWKISEGGNSGVFWGVFENEQYTLPYLTGPEIQILDDAGHPDGANKTHVSGSLFDMIAPSENVVHPVGEWNTMVLEINHKNNFGKVWLNGTEIVTFPVSGAEWDNMIQNSKFKEWKGFGTYKTGGIGLQDHGNAVSFKNIKIKDLGE